MDAAEWLGLGAALFITVANLPQTVKLVKTRSAKDISTMTYIFLVIGNLGWLVYGILTSDFPIMIGNAISSLLCGTILFIKIASKKEESSQ